MVSVSFIESLGFDLPAFFSLMVFGNEVFNYALALVLFTALTFTLRLFRNVVLARLRRLSLRTSTDIDDLVITALEKLGWTFYVLVSLLVSLSYLSLPAWLNEVLSVAWWIIGGFYLLRVALTIVDYLLTQANRKATDVNGVDEAIVSLFGRIIKGAVWVVALLFLLANFGINIAGLLAGAGIAGIAIAFALQEVLGDVFASFSIYLDKPFRKGDFIIIGSDAGTVEHIGIKSTRIRTLQGQELVVSNRELTTTRVNNFKKLERRRVVGMVGVTYDTSVVKLKKIPSLIQDIVTRTDNVDPDRAHLKSFGPSSIDFEYVFYVKQGDYSIFMDAQQQINLELVKAFKKEKIEFAFPTQTLHVHMQ